MAHITLTDFIDVGTTKDHDATSWQVALDPKFEKIVDQSLKDPVNLLKWYTPLKRIDGKPGYYKDEDALWARVKIHVEDYESEWFVIGPENQNIQDVIITEEGKPDIHTTSVKIDLQ